MASVSKTLLPNIVAGAAIRDGNGKRIDTTYATSASLSNYYTKTEVDTLLANAGGGGGGGGTTVVANPSGEATESLTKLQVGNTVYSISSGSGGGSADLSNYYTKTEVDELVDDILNDTIMTLNANDPRLEQLTNAYRQSITKYENPLVKSVNGSVILANATEVSLPNCECITANAGFSTKTTVFRLPKLKRLFYMGLFQLTTGATTLYIGTESNSVCFVEDASGVEKAVNLVSTVQTIYVPSALVAAYKASTGWSGVASKIVGV